MPTKEEMVQEFFCPGCVAGSDLECGAYKEARGGCDGWVPGTLIMPGGNIALGFPKGFNKIPFASYQRHGRGKFTDRLHSICLTARLVAQVTALTEKAVKVSSEAVRLERLHQGRPEAIIGLDLTDVSTGDLYDELREIEAILSRQVGEVPRLSSGVQEPTYNSGGAA